MDGVPADRVPLGRPINNVHIQVVDEQLALVPLGAPGEIVFSGICVGRGYINDPERTRAAFLTDPDGQRRYRSGDHGRWRPDGKLEFLGRRDSQLKIRGFRIELGEIENTLLRVLGVRDGAVVVAERADQSKHLVAFYSSHNPLDVDVLRDRLGESLPEYMVPSAFVWRERLPLTANSKIDKKTLTKLAGELNVVEDNKLRRSAYADRAATGGRLGEGAQRSAGTDWSTGPLLRRRRHVTVGSETGGQPGPCFLPQGPHRPSGPCRFGRAGRRQVRATHRAAAATLGVG
jgi:hypothetical protein